ncbi:DinB family protein [bacterium]|nr:DinB family protein [bacterium]
MIEIPRPAPDAYAPYFARHIDLVPDGDVLDMLTRNVEDTCALVAGFGEEGARHRYKPGKWSVKEVVGHVADTERLFVYRALSFARNDGTPLPGMDEDGWASYSNADAVPLPDLLDELLAVRRATVAFFANLDDKALARRGVASDNTFVVACVPWLVAGHEIHHAGVIRERYR